MKGSKVLLVFIFLITAVLGGVAIWIGIRLSQEEEVTPEVTEAATYNNGTIRNVCGYCCNSIPDSNWWDDGGGDCTCDDGDFNGCNGTGCNGTDCNGDDYWVQVKTCSPGNESYRGDNCGDQCMICEEGGDMIFIKDGEAVPADTPGAGYMFDSAAYASFFVDYDFNSSTEGEGIPNSCFVIQMDVVYGANPVSKDFVVWEGPLFETGWDPGGPCEATTTTTPTTTTTTTPQTTTTTPGTTTTTTTTETTTTTTPGTTTTTPGTTTTTTPGTTTTTPQTSTTTPVTTTPATTTTPAGTLPPTGITDSRDENIRLAVILIVVGGVVFFLNVSTKMFEPVFDKIGGWVDKSSDYRKKKEEFEAKVSDEIEKKKE